MAMAGMYMIINKIDNKKYIGSTISATEHRWGQHKSLIINNAHYNKHLQNTSAVLRKKRKPVGGFIFCDSREHMSTALKWVVGEQS
jgi:hypothetical protein